MAKRKPLTDEQRFAKLFPTRAARDAADEAVDTLSPREPMTAHVDAWVKAYVKAGGRRPKVLD